MNTTILLIFIPLVVVALVLGIWIGRKFRTKNSRSMEKAHEAIREKKEKSKQKVLELLQKQGRITNNDVEKLLNISDATAERYLNELEEEQKIIQNIRSGRNVFYTER